MIIVKKENVCKIMAGLPDHNGQMGENRIKMGEKGGKFLGKRGKKGGIIFLR